MDRYQFIRATLPGRTPSDLLETKYGGKIISFPMLEKCAGIRHVFSTRFGGVSSGIFQSMNLGFDRGDCPENVFENHRRLLETIGVAPEMSVHTKQEHGTNIRIVKRADCGKGIIKERDFSNIDGLITNEPGIALAVYAADCVPIFLADPKRRVIGTVHAGWRGTIGDIVGNAVRQMQEAFSVNAEELFCAIGPSICPSCYEVGNEVADQFEGLFPSVDFDVVIQKEGRLYLNLQEANRQLLMRTGVLPERIEISDLCTCCNPALLFSHRATNGKRGNNAGYIMLEESTNFSNSSAIAE